MSRENIKPRSFFAWQLHLETELSPEFVPEFIGNTQ